jgi:preprotein translocase subunit SecF
MNKRYYAFLVSGLFIALGVFLFFTRGFNQGIDFTGGTNIEVSFSKTMSVKDVRSALSDVGLGKSMIQRVGGKEDKFFIKTVKNLDEESEAQKKQGNENAENTEDAEQFSGIADLVKDAFYTEEEKAADTAGKMNLNESSENQIANFLVGKGVPRTIAEESAKKLVELRNASEVTGLIPSFSDIEALNLPAEAVNVLKEQTYVGHFTFLSVEMVGPQVGHDLRQKATLATVWAMIGMLIYIGFRFRFIFGIAAVITLLHDVLVSLTFILLFQVEVTLSVVAGILTIVGYSLNDTIVIFDRVRDNLTLMKREPAEQILDRSINQTLSRTIVTSGTTLCTVLALFFFGGEVIYAFSFTLLVGVVTGTYSSIFQSCAWLKIWEQKFVKRKK